MCVSLCVCVYMMTWCFVCLPQCIVLLEDVDVAFPRGNRSASSSASSSDFLSSDSTSEVTFSGLLNILDGAVSRLAALHRLIL
jgi:hypothetical protein